MCLQGGSVIIKRQCLHFGNARQPRRHTAARALPIALRTFVPGFVRNCGDSTRESEYKLREGELRPQVGKGGW